jgi:Flp pilus assembly pilin Flp
MTPDTVSFLSTIWSRRSSESGQTLVEYGMIVTLLAMAAVVILGIVGGNVVDLFTSVSSDFQNAAAP